jgi:hypothetical protein
MDTAMKLSSKHLGSLTSALLIGLNGAAFAQTSASSSGFSSTSVAPTPTSSQTAASTQGRDWIIKPRVTLTETFTDNVNINRANRDKQGDLITEVAPGLRIEARTARLKAYFDYALRGQAYARDSDYNRTHHFCVRGTIAE